MAFGRRRPDVSTVSASPCSSWTGRTTVSCAAIRGFLAPRPPTSETETSPTSRSPAATRSAPTATRSTSTMAPQIPASRSHREAFESCSPGSTNTAARKFSERLFLWAACGSPRAHLPGGIDDRVAGLRQDAPIVEVPPGMEVTSMIGNHGAPSTAKHRVAPEDEADETSPRVHVPRGAGAGDDAIRNRRKRERDEDESDPQPGDADGIGVEPAAADGVKRVEEHRLVLDLLVAMPPEQPGDARVDTL